MKMILSLGETTTGREAISAYVTIEDSSLNFELCRVDKVVLSELGIELVSQIQTESTYAETVLNVVKSFFHIVKSAKE